MRQRNCSTPHLIDFCLLGRCEQIDQIKREWFRTLIRYSVEFFDHYNQVSLISDLNDPKRVTARITQKIFGRTRKSYFITGLLMKDSMRRKAMNNGYLSIESDPVREKSLLVGGIV